MIKKYGKSLEAIFDIKQDFFSNDKKLLQDNQKITDVACQQAKREKCKNCDTVLKNEVDFIKQNISYVLCDQCNHLNSIYDDTEELANAIYVDEITDYSKTYSSENKEKWLSRAEKIYVPKADFLKDILLKEQDIKNFKINDLSAGSGYFVHALEKVGFTNVLVYEVSENQVKLSQEMLEKQNIIHTELNDLISIIKNADADEISMIGVLEHLTNPREILKEIKLNKSIKYLYISAPYILIQCIF